MFFQPPDDEPNCSLPSNISKGSTQSRRQKKLRRKNKLKAIKKHQIATTRQMTRTPAAVPTFPSIPITMSSYAENFTRAATWQLKNEVAFWKSKAMALEHENQILHRALRQNIIKNDERQSYCETPVAESYQEDELLEDPVSPDLADEVSEKEFEVSEEYIQFLRDNMVFRESARQERERIRALNDDEQKQIEEMEAGPVENTEDHQETLKKLYGDGSERIAALEMCLKTQFMSIVDQEKPMYWPNIPFNFNFG